MDLSTKYLGLDLPHPFVVGASYLTGELDRVRRAEDAGAAAIVLPSLFEEQVRGERAATLEAIEATAGGHGEAPGYFPRPEGVQLGIEAYLEHIARVRAAVDIPVIASLNGATPGGWLDYARTLQDAGVDALELNVYFVATDPELDGAAAERKVLEIARCVRTAVDIPVAVKLSPYFSSLANLAHQLDRLGIDGLVLFNRFFQPDIDLEGLEVTPALRLSDSSELGLRLAWAGILAGRVRTALAVAGGVHTAEDALKAVMSGADAVQMVSALLVHGVDHLTTVREGVAQWLERHEYESLAQAKGSMSLLRCPDPAAYQRGNYMRMIQGWRP